MVDSATAAHVP